MLALGVSHKLDLGDAWSCATHVSCRSIDQQILSGAVETAEPGFFRGRKEAIPGKTMDCTGPHSVLVAHDEDNIVTGVRDQTIVEITILHT